MSKKKKKRERDEHAPEPGTDDAQAGPKTDDGAADPKRDVRQIDAGELESHDFPSLPNDYRVVVAGKVFDAVKEHAKSDTSVEQCGMLAGRLLADAAGPYLLIEEVIEGTATRRSGSQVTFTHETWQHVHQVMEEQFADLRIVGWYHSHPGLGIFLSDMDQFIQDNFFDAPHSVALVYDPCADTRGIFYWRDGRSERLRRYWIGEDLCYDLETAAPAEQEAAAKAADESDEPLRERPYPSIRVESDDAPLDAKSAALWALCGAVALFLAFWLGAGMSSRTLGRTQEDFRQVFANVIRTGLFRDGLEGDLAAVRRDVDAATRQIRGTRAQLARKDFAAGLGEEGASFKAGVLRQLDGAKQTLLDAERRAADMELKYLAADRIIRQMGIVATLPDEVQKLKAGLQLERNQLATLCETEAQFLLALPPDAGTAARTQRARQLREMAVRLAPHLRPEIDRRLPEFAPPRRPGPTTPPAGAGGKAQ